LLAIQKTNRIACDPKTILVASNPQSFIKDYTMNMMILIRIYHAALASLSLLAYLTGELGIIHAWLGYGVSMVILLRLLWALSGNRQVGLTRFYPSFEGLQVRNLFTHPAVSKTLMLGIAVSLITVTLTGISLDRGKAIGIAKMETAGKFAKIEVISPAYADDNDAQNGNGEENEFLEEIHEFFANMLLFFVGMHVTYLLIFKTSLAKFMLFIPKPSRTDIDKDIH
jgi:cytochrome b